MEFLEYAFVPLIGAMLTLCIIFSTLAFLIIKKCKKKQIDAKEKLTIVIVCALISFVSICIYVLDNSTEEPAKYGTIESYNDLSINVLDTQEIDISSTLGDSKDNPIVITAEKLASKINENINDAKEEYNGKWVKITGTISDTSDGGIMYGYYLYGKSALSGYTGLRIMCWCEDGPYSGSVLGDTQTFVGQVLEITTVNVTEIVDCERITE